VAAKKVRLLLGTQVKEIHPERVVFDSGDALGNDYVLVFAGGVLPTAFLEAAGVEVQTFKGEEYAPAN
jgi:NADH dehydrogenase FAD-containing subunit